MSITTFSQNRLTIISLALCIAFCFLPLPGTTQPGTEVEQLQTLTPARSLEMKVVWQDIRGERHKTRGWLLLVEDDALVLSVESGSGRAIQQKIHASNIIKVKYKERGANPLPGVAASAFQGAISGGYVPVQTGNLGIDLLAGALQGAIGGLFQTNSFSRRIIVDRRKDIFKNYVYPDLVAGR